MTSSYPPQPGPPPMGPPPYAPPPPPKKKRTGLIIVLVIVVVLLLLLGGCIAFLGSVASQVATPTSTSTAVETTEADSDATSSADDPTSEAPTEPPADEPTEAPPAEEEPYKLTVTECKRGDYGTFDVSVKVENRSDKEVTYIFDIGLYDTDDNTVGTGFGSIEVRAGKSGKTTAFASLSDEDYKGKVKCRVEVTDF